MAVAVDDGTAPNLRRLIAGTLAELAEEKRPLAQALGVLVVGSRSINSSSAS